MTARLLSFVLTGLCAITACASLPDDALSYGQSSLRIFPEQAVMNAAAISPKAVEGIFEMPVRSIGRSREQLFLNSETDYRDPRCLTLVLRPEVERALGKRFGATPAEFLEGKTIAVRGAARRVRIDFLVDGRATGKYYYQTQIQLREARHLTVAGERVSAR